MGNAIWLNASLPKWFLSLLVNPFVFMPWSVMAPTGVFAAFAGILLAVRKRERRALWALPPFMACHLLVTVAGLFRGQVKDGADYVVLIFLAAQILYTAAFIAKTKGARLISGALSLFNIAYAFMAIFIAAMAFPDSWI